MARTEIPVEGMRCEGCERTLERALTRLEGVRQAKPDRVAERVIVDYDPGQVSERRLREQVELCGYEVAA